MALTDAVEEIQTEVGKVSGIRDAPNYPPEESAVYPFAVAYPGNGTQGMGPPEQMKGLHNIFIELHVSRKDLPRDVELATGFVDSIPNALFNYLKNSSNSNYDTHGNISYEFATMVYGGIETVGYIFTINEVKIKSTIS